MVSRIITKNKSFRIIKFTLEVQMQMSLFDYSDRLQELDKKIIGIDNS